MTYNVFSGTLNPTHFTSLLPNLNVLVAVSKGMRAVKLFANKIL